MSKGVKYTLLSLGIIGAIVGGYFVFRKKEEEESPTPSPKPSSSSKYKNNDFPLKKNSGDGGQSVKRVHALQRYLNSKGASLTVDGKFGPKTLSAVKEYIDSSGLVLESYYNENIQSFENESATTTQNNNSLNLGIGNLGILDQDGDGIADFLQNQNSLNYNLMDNTDTIYNNPNLNLSLQTDTLPDMHTGSIMFSGGKGTKNLFFDGQDI